MLESTTIRPKPEPQFSSSISPLNIEFALQIWDSGTAENLHINFTHIVRVANHPNRLREEDEVIQITYFGKSLIRRYGAYPIEIRSAFCMMDHNFLWNK